MPIDAGIEACIENRRVLALLILPGTLVFLLLFLAFSGAFGLTVLVGMFLLMVEGGLALGIALLYFRYGEERKAQRLEVADIIEAFITDSDVMSEWGEFLMMPLHDPELELIRSLCQRLPQDFPPAAPGQYCHPDGLEVLLPWISRLRAGIATKFYDEFRHWWSRRDERRARRAVRKAERRDRREARAARREVVHDAARERSVLAAAASAVHGQPATPLQRVLRQAPTDPALRPAAAPLQPQPSRAPLQSGPPSPGAPLQPAPPAAPAPPLQPDPAIMTAPASPDLPPTFVPADVTGLAPGDATAATPQVAPAAEQSVTPVAPAVQPAPIEAAPPEPVAPEPAWQPAGPPRKGRRGGMTEAGAIEHLMRQGFTAQDFDRVQRQLVWDRGKDVSPEDVVKALLEERKKHGRRAAKAPKPSRARGGPHRPEVRVRTGGRVRWGRVQAAVIITGAAALPFVAYRIPHGEPILIEGELRDLAVDPSANVLDLFRSQFESFYGNRGVSIAGGPRIYLTAEDYERCWEGAPSVEEGRNGFTVRLVAEARPLLLGGYEVATVRSVERIDNPDAEFASPSLYDDGGWKNAARRNLPPKGFYR